MFEWLALAAALCWAVGSLFASGPARRLGGFHFTRRRLWVMTAVFAVILTWRGVPATALAQWDVLALSSLIGIVFGDICLFATLSRLGPRRTGILFATNAPMGAFFSWWFLGSQYGWRSLLGGLLVVCGVFVAIWFGRQSRTAPFNIHEQTRGQLWAGVALGLCAALGQALGSLLVKPVLDAGADPWAVAGFRIVTAAVAIQLYWWWRLPPVPADTATIGWRDWLNLSISGLFGMVLGMTLLMMAFARGDLGIAAILSSTTPILILPLLWWQTRIAPSPVAWLGAILSVVGTALLVS